VAALGAAIGSGAEVVAAGGAEVEATEAARAVERKGTQSGGSDEDQQEKPERQDEAIGNDLTWRLALKGDSHEEPGVSGVGGPRMSWIDAVVKAVGEKEVFWGIEGLMKGRRGWGEWSSPNAAGHLPLGHGLKLISSACVSLLHALVDLGDEPGISPVADFDTIAFDLEEVKVRGCDVLLIEIGSGGLVPRAKRPSLCERPGDEETEENQ
jgi:hypothetical protein